MELANLINPAMGHKSQYTRLLRLVYAYRHFCSRRLNWTTATEFYWKLRHSDWMWSTN